MTLVSRVSQSTSSLVYFDNSITNACAAHRRCMGDCGVSPGAILLMLVCGIVNVILAHGS